MSAPPSPDPITAILVAVTEIRGKIGAAMDRLERHEHQLDTHAHTLIEHGERITSLEAINTADNANAGRTYSGRVVLWAGLGVAVSLISTIVAIFLALHQYGA